MATNGRALKSWIYARPIVSASLAATVSFLLGIGAGGSGPQTELSLLKNQLGGLQAETDQTIAALEASADSLEAENTDLIAENADLEEQIQMLNARRELPKLVGSTEGFATSLETKYGWDLVRTFRFSTRPAGTVLSQRPAAGTMMQYGGVYRIVVAQQPPTVPKLRGLTASRAKRLLTQNDWEIVTVEQISSARVGTVLSVSPGAGTSLMPGSTITITIAKKAPPAAPSTSSSSGSGCTPGYSPCLPPASDYDCAGGSGDGPKYTGYVTVTGSDPYGLDSDGDGAGCES